MGRANPTASGLQYEGSSSQASISLSSFRKPPTLSRDKPLTLHDPGQDLVTCKEGLETGGGTIIFPLKLSVSRGPSRACEVPQSRRKNTFNKKNKKTSSDFLFSTHRHTNKTFEISENDYNKTRSFREENDKYDLRSHTVRFKRKRLLEGRCEQNPHTSFLIDSFCY